jgi:N6-adenosine-specific RNA methylase IME4
VGFVWLKTYPSTEVITLDGGGLFVGMGHHTRANTEDCLIAIHGSPERRNKDVHQVIIAPVSKHSAKPEEARRRIERLYPGPYLELFARQPREGWNVWGNEIGKET